ncbi:MAG: TIGR02281 family clan AA aspartic protease [Mesorhizobium amorphae]|nr:MAG: TIGR02281 family clan AA aspartic protease [Mesorhizobium amorphae]
MAVFWIAMLILGGGLAVLLLRDDAGSMLGLSNDQFAGVIALSALLFVIASGVFARRTPLGPALRNVAAWLGILVLLVAGYGYRYELQDVASRVTAGLVPGSPLSSFDAEGRASVMVNRALGGHFGTRATVDGASIDFLIDTGASATVLSVEDARRAGIDTESLAFTVPVSTANGVTTAARATVSAVTVGSITRRNLPVLVAQPGVLGQSLLGMNFLGTLSGLDIRGDRMTLRD